MNDKLKFYDEILKAIGYSTDVDGSVYRVARDGKIPAIVNIGGRNRTLYMPTDQVLKSQDWKDKVAFHPLSESVTMGCSEVQNFIMERASLLQYAIIITIIPRLFQLYMEPNWDRYNFKLKNLLKLFTVDEELLKYFEEVKAEGVKPEWFKKTPLTKYTIARNKEINGFTYQRVCYFSSPLLAAKNFYGLPQKTKKQIELRDKLLQLYKAVIPSDSYEGSNSKIAPNLCAFLNAYAVTSAELNELLEVTQLEDVPRVDIGYQKRLKDLHKMKNLLPNALPGNIGLKVERDEKGNHVTVSLADQIPVIEPTVNPSVRQTPNYNNQYIPPVVERQLVSSPINNPMSPPNIVQRPVNTGGANDLIAQEIIKRRASNNFSQNVINTPQQPNYGGFNFPRETVY